jgi:hypothetical protein
MTDERAHDAAGWRAQCTKMIDGAICGVWYYANYHPSAYSVTRTTSRDSGDPHVCRVVTLTQS